MFYEFSTGDLEDSKKYPFHLIDLIKGKTCYVMFDFIFTSKEKESEEKITKT